MTMKTSTQDHNQADAVDEADAWAMAHVARFARFWERRGMGQGVAKPSTIEG
jgi:hypothetical protein